jgi:hypothetical protein
MCLTSLNPFKQMIIETVFGEEYAKWGRHFGMSV